MRGLLKRERQQAWKRPRLVIIGRGTVLSRVICCDAVWKWWDGAGTWLGGSRAVDRNARRRNIKERNQIFGLNMAASISNYNLATKQKTDKDSHSPRWAVSGSEFQTDGAKNRKARLEKSVLMNGWTSSEMADERKVRLQTRS